MRVLITMIIAFIVLNANDLNINKKAVEELNNYSITLPKHIYNPFVLQVVYQKNKYIKDVIKSKPVFVERKLELLAVLNNKALVKIGNHTTKWLKEGDKIDEYTIKKIINSRTILVSIRGKMKMITIKNKFNIKVTQ